MCCQQSATTNKLCYVEAWLADAELWHESWRNQVMKCWWKIWFCVFDFPIFVFAVWRPTCCRLAQLAGSTSLMLIVMTREIIRVVSSTPHQFSSVYCCASRRRRKTFLISLISPLFSSSTALGDIAQATVMVHVLIGKQKSLKFVISASI